MAEYLSLIGLTLAFTFVFAYMVASADIEAIKGNWAKRRCEVPVILTGNLYKPKTYQGTSAEFAADNFKFCVEKLADDVIKIAFAPFFSVANDQINVQNSLNGPFNSIRIMIQNGWTKFNSIMDMQWRQYKALQLETISTWQRLGFAIGRVKAIVLSVFYLGWSLVTVMNNTLKLAITAIVVFIGILVAMLLLIWFGLIPFLGVIIMTIAFLAVLDSQTDGWLDSFNVDAGPFCIDPDAIVLMADGSEKPLKDIQLGDVLSSCVKNKKSPNIVEGILIADASKETLVSIDGIIMSNSHRVKHKNKWILAKEHPNAQKIDTTLKEVICLNTTHHSILHKSSTGFPLEVSDWEEVDTWKGKRQWIDWVHTKLNGSGHRVHRYPTAVPLCSPDVQVVCQTRGWIKLKDISIGDSILGQTGFTKVLARYNGQLLNEDKQTTPPDWISDGVWIQVQRFWSTRGSGVHHTPNSPATTVPFNGLNLVTKDGTFYIRQATGTFLVRDFTEVGIESIDKSYSWLSDAMNTSFPTSTN